MPAPCSADLTAAANSTPKKVMHYDPQAKLFEWVMQADLKGKCSVTTCTAAKIDRMADATYAKINVPGNAWPLTLYKIDDNETEVSHTAIIEKRGIPAVPIAEFSPGDLKGCAENEMPWLDNQELWVGGYVTSLSFPASLAKHFMVVMCHFPDSQRLTQTGLGSLFQEIHPVPVQSLLKDRSSLRRYSNGQSLLCGLSLLPSHNRGISETAQTDVAPQHYPMVLFDCLGQALLTPKCT